MTSSLFYDVIHIVFSQVDCWVSSSKAETFNLELWKQAVQGMTPVCHKVLLCTKAKLWERTTSSKEDNSYYYYEGILYLSYLFLAFLMLKFYCFIENLNICICMSWFWLCKSVNQSILPFIVLSSFIYSLTHITLVDNFFYASISSMTKADLVILIPSSLDWKFIRMS